MPMFMLNGKQYGGNGGNYQVARMSKADYDALTDAQKNDGTLRIVVDSAGNSVNYMSAQVAGTKTDDTLTNLLNPTAGSSTVGGIHCTANGDGTYTFNGTTSATANFFPLPVGHGYDMKSGITYHLCGCPQGGSSTTYELIAEGELGTQYKKQYAHDYGNGVSFTVPQADIDAGYKLRITMSIKHDVTNVVFKPMLTTDLQATYDDFVGYTGGTGRLNSDVAEHEKEISRINSELTDSKNWKFLGNLNSGGSLNFPSEFKEINFCFVILSGTNMVETSMVAPYDVFTSVDRYYRTGYYANSNSNASFSVLASRSRATGLNVWQNGSDLTNTSNIACRIYYR